MTVPESIESDAIYGSYLASERSSVNLLVPVHRGLFLKLAPFAAASPPVSAVWFFVPFQSDD